MYRNLKKGNLKRKWVSKCGKFTGYLQGKGKTLKLTLNKRSAKLLAYLNIKRLEEQDTDG